MAKLSLLLLSLTCSLCGCSQMGIGKVSYLVGKKQDDKTGKFKQNTFYQIRKELFDKYPSIFKSEIDTVYFIDKYEIEEATYYGAIWTKTDTVSYSFFANEIRLNNGKSFTAKVMNLVPAWDTASLRNEEMRYSDSPRTVYAARGIVVGNKCLIDTIKMKDFIFER